MVYHVVNALIDRRRHPLTRFSSSTSVARCLGIESGGSGNSFIKCNMLMVYLALLIVIIGPKLWAQLPTLSYVSYLP